MPPLPWKWIAKPPTDRASLPSSGQAGQAGAECVALLSYLPLKSYWMVPKFMWFTLETVRQLARSRGLIGYSLLAEPLRRQFWTLSAWQDRQSLTDFVEQIPHSKIMQTLAPHMEKTKFATWTVKTEELPLSWAEAKARM